MTYILDWTPVHKFVAGLELPSTLPIPEIVATMRQIAGTGHLDSASDGAWAALLVRHRRLPGVPRV